MGGGVTASTFDEAAFTAQFKSAWQLFKASACIAATSSPLKWWHTIGRANYSPLLQIARRYMTPLATSAIVEGSFSKAKRWCQDQRSSLSDVKFDVLVTLDTKLTDMTDEELESLLDVGWKTRYGQRAPVVDECMAVEFDVSSDVEDSEMNDAEPAATGVTGGVGGDD